MRSMRPCIVMLCMAAAPAVVAANGAPIEGAAGWWSLQAGPVRSVWQEEAASGRRLLRESGVLRSVRMELGRTTAWGRWSLDGQFIGGQRDYEGQTNFGQPAFTTVDLQQQRYQVRWERSMGAWSAGASLHTHLLRRDIQATATALGLDERYRWWTPMLSLGSRHGLGSGWETRLQLELGRDVAGHLLVDLPGADRLKITTGTGPVWGLQAKLRWSPAPTVRSWPELTVSLEHESRRWSQGPSTLVTRNGIVSGSALQPATRSAQSQLMVGARWSFD